MRNFDFQTTLEEHDIKLRVFTLRFDPDLPGFDDAGLQAFCGEHEALEVWQHFFEHQGVPCWGVMLAYREPRKPGASRKPAKVNWRAELDEVQQRRFDALRAWRNDKAKREGRPPYVLFTNQHMAEIVRAMPQTLTGLQEIEGIGAGKAQAFGTELLGLLASLGSPEAADGA